MKRLSFIFDFKKLKLFYHLKADKREYEYLLKNVSDQDSVRYLKKKLAEVNKKITAL